MLCGSSIFFFFKQKTAYERRISDWSSDVCSSDLRDQPAVQASHAKAVGLGHVRSDESDRLEPIGRGACRVEAVKRDPHPPAIGSTGDKPFTLVAQDRKSVV